MLDWPRRLRDADLVDYLKQVHNLHYTNKTIRNRRTEGTGPKTHYIGSRPYTTPEDVDRWVEERISDKPANGRPRRATVGDEQPEAA